MDRVKTILIDSGIQELLKSEEVMSVCREIATNVQAVANSSSPGYEMEERKYHDRSGYAVFPGDDNSFYDNLKNNTLEKAKGAI